MSYSGISSPSPVNPTGPRIYALPQVSPNEADDAEPAPVSRPVSPTGAILRACGPTAVALWHIAVDNLDCGMPNTYAILEEQCQLSTRQLQRLVNAMEREGFIDVVRGRGRGKETVITPVKGDRKGDSKGDTDVVHIPESTTERVTERVTSPPHTPPSELTNVKKEEVYNPPNPPQPKKPAKREPYTEGFDQFWAAYPRRDDRKGALKVWSRLKPDAALLAEMLTAIDRQGLAKRDRRYVPMPTTWLNGERWTDETQGTDPKPQYKPGHPKYKGIFVG